MSQRPSLIIPNHQFEARYAIDAIQRHRQRDVLDRIIAERVRQLRLDLLEKAAALYKEQFAEAMTHIILWHERLTDDLSYPGEVPNDELANWRRGDLRITLYVRFDQFLVVAPAEARMI